MGRGEDVALTLRHGGSPHSMRPYRTEHAKTRMLCHQSPPTSHGCFCARNLKATVHDATRDSSPVVAGVGGVITGNEHVIDRRVPTT